MIGKNGKLKDIGHGSHVMSKGFLDLDSSAPQTQKASSSRKVLEWDPDSAPWNLSVASIMLILIYQSWVLIDYLRCNSYNKRARIKFLAVEHAIDKLLAWVVNGTFVSWCKWVTLLCSSGSILTVNCPELFRAVLPDGLKLFNFIDDRLRQTCGVQVAFCCWGAHIISNERVFLFWFMLHAFSWTGWF